MTNVTLHRVILVLMLACASWLPAGCAREKTGIEKVRQFLDRGELEPAMVAGRDLLQRDALNAEAQLLIGRIFTAMGDAKSAEQEIRKAGNLGMDRATMNAALAEAMLIGGQYRRVLDEIEADRQGGGDAAAGVLTARGFAQLTLGNKKDAAAEFAEALKRVPEFPGALTGEGRLALLDGEAATAVALAERAIAKQPNHLDAWSLKADAALASGKPDSAIAVYEQALKVVPGNMPVRFAIARLQIATGKMADAQVHLNRLRKWEPQHPMVNLLQALLYLRQRNFASARDFALAAIKVAPQYGPALLVLAESEVALGQTQQAEARYQQLLQASPRSSVVRKLYATALLQMNQPARAIVVLEPLLDGGGSDGEAMLLAGEAYMQSREYAKASTFLDKAAAATPAAANRLVTLGLRQMAGGDAERGMAELVKAAQLDKDGFRAEFMLALAYLRRADYAKALQAAKQLETKRPKDPIAHDLAGAAYLGMGDQEAARDSLKRALALDANYLPASINMALLEMSMGLQDPARKRLEDVLARDKGNVDAIAALARLTGIPGESTRLLEQARTADPKALAVRRALVRQHLADNNFPAALSVAREMEKSAPDDPHALDALGAAQLASGQHKEALATYERLRAKLPNSAAVQLYIGQVQEVLGDAKAAEATYVKAVAMGPGYYTDPTVALAKLYARTGRTDEAMKLAEDVRGRFPKLAQGNELIGDLLVRREQFAQAARSYDAAYAIKPSGTIAVKYHGAMVRAGKKVDAGRLDQWVKAHPDDVATRQYLADQQLRAGDLAAAAENYRNVVKAQPGNAFAMNNLANVYLLQKDPRALETAEAALKLSPNNANIMDTAGFALTESGAAARAVPLLRKAVSLNPEATEYRVHLASALAKSGDREGARAEVKRLVDAGRTVELDEATRAALK